MDIETRQELVNRIDKLNKEEHIEILKIILKQNNINYSENKNGTFLNMNDIDDNILKDVEQYVNYVNLKNKNISDIEDKISKLEQNMDIK